ncbi:MAG: MFS transporter [Alphaproteobacteria bacterium]|nr:MFS transporter [Alphaproteobacteria bacterium]
METPPLSSPPPSSSPLSSSPLSPPRKRHVAAVVVGNALEFYDFTTYAYFAAQIGATFFPFKTPFLSLLASLAAFGIGFLGRPVGGVLIGAYADRAGRRPAMMLSFALMGVAILAFVLMPSYARIGIAAPVLVVIIRFLQGIAVGGDVGPTTAFLLEAAPERRRGFFAALQFSSQGLSSVCAGAIGVTLASVLGAQELQDWGWRLALGLGAAILPFGFLIRRTLPETLHPHEIATTARPPLPPRNGWLGARLPPHAWRTIVLGFCMLASATVGFYVVAYLTTYASQFLHMKTSVSLGATLVFGIANIVFSALAGHLSDLYGRKPVMIVPRVLFLFAIWPAFALLVARRDTATLLGAALVLGALGQMAAVVVVSLSEALPKQVRSAGLATTYALAISIFGGTAQFNVTWLIGATGDVMVPAYYLMAATALGIVAMALMHETAPVKLPGDA